MNFHRADVIYLTLDIGWTGHLALTLKLVILAYFSSKTANIAEFVELFADVSLERTESLTDANFHEHLSHPAPQIVSNFGSNCLKSKKVITI